jgi:5-methylcytosine-specific restriction endonuclease McrA
MSLSLRSLSERDILSRTQELVARERKLTLSVLLHLNEIERRKLHLKRGYASMFVYCTTGLGYSESAANRRIRTARCIACFPEVLELLLANQVNLSTISQASKILNPGNSREVLIRIRGKSQRDVAAIVAEYEPRSALPPDRVRTVVVPVVAVAQATVTSPSKGAPSDVSEIHLRSGGRKVATSEPDVDSTSHCQVRAGAASTTGDGSPVMQFERRALIQFSAREELLKKLAHVRSLASHRLPANAPLEQLIEFLAEYFTDRKDPKAREARREKRKQKAEARGRKAAPTKRSAKSPQSSRSIPAHVRDRLFIRDSQQCTFVGGDGRRCESTHVLQIDHINPVARGGPGSMDNLRLLCAHHNRLEAERIMGRSGARRTTT